MLIADYNRNRPSNIADVVGPILRDLAAFQCFSNHGSVVFFP